MIMTYDASVNAMHIRFGGGKVSTTVEIEPFVLVDLDDRGHVLGIEFVNASDLWSFLSRHGGTLSAEVLAPLVAAPLTGR